MLDALTVQLPPNLPLERRKKIQTELIQRMIFEILLEEYLQANNIRHTDEDLAEVQQRVQAVFPQYVLGAG